MFVDLIDSQLQNSGEYNFLVSNGNVEVSTQSHLNKLLNAATELVMSSNALPTNVDYSVAASHPTFGPIMKELSQCCVDTIHNIEDSVMNICEGTTDNIAKLEALEALSNEICRGLNAHRDDEYQSVSAYQRKRDVGTKRRVSEASKPYESFVSSDNKFTFDLERRLHNLNLELHSATYDRVLSRPQNQWEDLIDNFSLRSLYRPELPKFHALQDEVPVEDDADQPDTNPFTVDFGYERQFVPRLYPRAFLLELLPYRAAPTVVLPHPYIAELNALEWEDVESDHSHKGSKILGGRTLMNPNKNATGAGSELGAFTLVDTLAGLEDMINRLKGCDVIAIDVEHHSRQSYRGFVCLLQITGAGDDWIIDPFGIFKEMWRLNEVTTNPGILKIMHGAECDILWLQRDFGIYVVNMFDTLKASEVCSISGGHSLAALLKNLMAVNLDKTYQRADWRIRPLSRGMLDYATADTHYLIELYNILKNKAIAMDQICKHNMEGKCADSKINQIMNASRKVCMRQYREKRFDIISRAFTALRKSRRDPRKYDPLSLNLLINLISFRNYAAKVLDESDGYLFPDYAAVMMSTAGSTSGTSHSYWKSLSKQMLLLEKEIPYLVNLRNNINDALEIIEASGVDFVEPITLASLGDFVCQDPQKAKKEPQFSSATEYLLHLAEMENNNTHNQLEPTDNMDVDSASVFGAGSPREAAGSSSGRRRGRKKKEADANSELPLAGENINGSQGNAGRNQANANLMDLDKMDEIHSQLTQNNDTGARQKSGQTGRKKKVKIKNIKEKEAADERNCDVNHHAKEANLQETMDIDDDDAAKAPYAMPKRRRNKKRNKGAAVDAAEPSQEAESNGPAPAVQQAIMS